jgi:hypothetical protein
MNTEEKIALAIFGPLVCFALYTLFVWLPVYVYAEARCLESGYPETKTTFILESYCTGLEGDARTKVIRLN